MPTAARPVLRLIAPLLACALASAAFGAERYATDPTCEAAMRPQRALVVESIEKEQKRTGADEQQLRQPDQRVLKVCTHHANYLMYTQGDIPPSHAAEYGYLPQDTELKIQVSVKVPVFSGAARDLFGHDASLWLAYTQTAWWQIAVDSAPFRETNYEPEVFLDQQLPDAWGSRQHRWRIGFGHQSNGQAGTLSRSWNRIRGELDLNYGHLSVRTRLWARIPESAADDDNPDIDEYLGYGDIAARWRFRSGALAAKLVNAVGPGCHRGVQLEWMFNMGVEGEPAWLLQLYHGYGESLIDYDDKITRLGIGLVVGDLL